MALFGRGTPSRLDELRKAGVRDASPRQFMAAAEELRRAGRLRECIETLENGVRENPAYVAAHVALGRAFQQAELFPRAIGAYQEALRIDRENLVAVRQLAECYLHQGEKLEALKKLKLFRGLKPGEKDVDEQIQKLEEELLAARRGAPETRKEATGSFALPRTRTGTIPPLPTPTSSYGTTAPPPVPPPAFATAASQAPPPAPPPPLPPSQPEPFAAAAPAATPDFDALLAAPAAPATAVPAFESFLDEIPPAPAPVAAPAFVPPPPPPAYQAPAAVAAPPEPSVPPESPAAEPAPLPAEPEERGTLPGVFVAEPESPPPAAEPRHPAPESWRAEPVSQPGTQPGPEPEPAPVEAAQPEPAPAVPSVTETLAELYRSQGHLEDAARAYESLAVASPDAGAADTYRRRAAEIETQERATPAGRLRAFARRLPAPPTTRVEELEGVLASLRTRAPGVRTAVLTDLEGLPLVSAGESGSSTEVLVAELSAFWKGVERTEQDVGGGALRTVAIRGEAGAALVTAVSPEYSLVLHVERDVPLGRIRYEAARAAGLLRPALG